MVRSFLKFIMIAIGLVLIGLGVAGILFLPRAERFLVSKAEARLGLILDTEVKIGAIRPAPMGRGIELRELTVRNPEPFQAGEAIECSRILLRLDPRTFFARNPAVEQIDFEGLKINLRHEAGDGTNLGYMAKRASDLAAKDTSKTRILVRRIECPGARMKLESNVLPLPGVSMELAPFTLENLGDGKPISTAKATSIFLRSLIIETVTLKGLLRPLADLLRGELGDS